MITVIDTCFLIALALTIVAVYMFPFIVIDNINSVSSLIESNWIILVLIAFVVCITLMAASITEKIKNRKVH